MNAETENSLKEKPTQTLSSSFSSPSFRNSVFGNSSESSKKLPEVTAPMIRAYNQAKMPRLRWTEETHRCFVHAVQSLGGAKRAKPKKVFELMNVKEITLTQVKSRLQMYRTMKQDQQVTQEFPAPIFTRIPSYGQQHIHQLSRGTDHFVEQLSRIQAQWERRRRVGYNQFSTFICGPWSYARNHRELECYSGNQGRSILTDGEENKRHNYIIFKDIMGSQSVQENKNRPEMESLGAAAYESYHQRFHDITAIRERGDEDMLSLSKGSRGLNNQDPRPDANDVSLELNLKLN